MTLPHPTRLAGSAARAAALLISLLLLTVAAPAAAQRGYPPEMGGTVAEVYRTVGDVELKMYLCNPEDHTEDDERPAMVFFFGGGWNSGTPQQFLPYCQYLAGRGMVGAVADYRVASRHGVTADECVKDAKSAVRWLRTHADRLGIDPNRIGAGGGSAGGHLAAATATLPGHDPEPDGASPVPDALVLFNPATVLAPVKGDPPLTEEQAKRRARLAERLGAPSESMSPFHHLRAGLPPTLLMHGLDDDVVPHATAARFCEGLNDHEVRCLLVSYRDQGHGFFNLGRGEGEDLNKMHEDTLYRMDGFLYTLEWLDPKPNPDGTPRKRETALEQLQRLFGNGGEEDGDDGEAPAEEDSAESEAEQPEDGARK